jgi:hypothetical protein
MKEVVSPITRKDSLVGSIRRAESPGARSMPGRSDQEAPPLEPQRPVDRFRDNAEPAEQPGGLHIHGPED